MPDGQFGNIVVLQNEKYDFLIDQALQNVWCNPDQDNQHIIAPHRISKPVGVMNFCSVLKRDMSLPSKGDIYHLFQIGHLDPIVIGLYQNQPVWLREQWFSFSDAMKRQNIFIDIYSDEGVHIPRYEAFYCFNEDSDLIIAIKENSNISFNYKQSQPYLRLYTNAYFKSIRNINSIKRIYTTGVRLGDMNHLLTVQAEFETYLSKPGYCFAYVNGYLVDRLDAVTMRPGDYVEFVYDSSVKRIVNFVVQNLPVFNSELDNKRKYLLHYPTTGEQETIDYLDDIDVYVLDRLANNRFYGVYYHRNSVDAMRMVTHRDYSVTVPYFANLASQLQTNAGDRIVDTQHLEFQLVIRESGYLRPLIFENNRIQELYKLPDTLVLNAIGSLTTTIDLWKASSLEKSAYTKLMGSKPNEISQQLIQDTYGYNSIAKLLADTPTKTYDYSNRKQIKLNRGLYYNSTAYEYNADGGLINHYNHDSGRFYNCVNNNCALVEMISGIGTYTPDVRFGDQYTPLPVPEFIDYRVYRCYRTGDVMTKWEDVTNTHFYRIVDNKIIWSDTDYNAFIMVRTARTFLCYDLNMKSIGGSLRFTLSEMEDRGDGMKNHILPVPLGDLDIILNDEWNLIENVDYVVNFPEVVIINKEFLRSPRNSADQKIHIRYTGFCKRDMQHRANGDKGWVRNGLLSSNNRFDIRDDKVCRIVVGGRLKTKDDLLFAENHAGLGITHADNGKPYQIRDIVVPVKGYVTEGTEAFREKALLIDKSVSDYLTQLLPELNTYTLSALPNRYNVFSPFLARIIYDIETGLLPEDVYSKNLSDNEVLQICKPYDEWLRFDPINPDLGFDLDYFVIHPHNDFRVKELSLFAYRFLTRVVNLYCKDIVELSPFVALKTVS